jgi:hypothetical protein
MSNNIIMSNNVNKIIKYFLMGLIAFIAIRYIPSNALDDMEILVVAMTVSIGYAIIDRLLASY